MEVMAASLGPIGANCYFIRQNQKLCLIDPGDEVEKILNLIKEKQDSLELILLTHGHYDHTGAVKALVSAFPSVKVFMHQADVHNNQPRLFPLGGELQEILPLSDQQKIPFADLEFTVFTTPGHSDGSVCFLLENHLFTGDTLFAGSMGRVDLLGGSYSTIMKSLVKLSKIPPEILVHPGHERSSTIEKECRSNPYMLEALSS